VLEEVLKARAKLHTATSPVVATTTNTAATQTATNSSSIHNASNDSSNNINSSSSSANSSDSNSDCDDWFDSWHSQGWNSVVQRDLQRALVDPFHGVRAVACSCYTHLLDSDWSDMAQVT
jgi:hypothetical protein